MKKIFLLMPFFSVYINASDSGFKDKSCPNLADSLARLSLGNPTRDDFNVIIQDGKRRLEEIKRMSDLTRAMLDEAVPLQQPSKTTLTMHDDENGFVVVTKKS